MCGTLCRDFLHFCMGESTQNRLTSTGRNPYNGNRNHVGQWNRRNFGMNNTEAFEFLLSWKDDVLMNCLSGRRDKAFDPQAMRRAGRGRDLSVRPVGHRPGDLPSGQRLVHRPAAQVLNRSDTKDAFIFHKRLTSCAICIIIKPSSVCSEKRAEQTRGSLFPFVCSALFCSRYANEHAVTGRRSGGFYAGCSNHRLRCRWRGCRL